MHRHIDAEVLPDPRAFGGDLGVAVVASRNEQGGDLQPHVGLVPQVEQGVQHVVQTPDADLAAKSPVNAFKSTLAASMCLKISAPGSAHMYPAVTATALIPRSWHASATSAAYFQKIVGSLRSMPHYDNPIRQQCGRCRREWPGWPGYRRRET